LSDTLLAILLEEKLTQLRFLEKRWSNFFVTPVRLRSAVKNASHAARIASGESVHQPLEWLTPVTSPNRGIDILSHGNRELSGTDDAAPNNHLFGEAALPEQEDEDENRDTALDMNLFEHSRLIPGTDETVLNDYLLGEAAVSGQEDEEDDDSADGYVVDIVWAVPVSFLYFYPRQH
jgi:hypothetical protein